MLFSLLCLLCCLCIARILLHRKRSDSDPPMLSGNLPIIGLNLKFLGDSINMNKVLTELSEECLSKGGVTTGTFGFMNMYFVTDPEAFLTISNTCLDKGFVYNFFKNVVGDGLVTANRHMWKRHRKLLQPAFSQSVLNRFMDIFNNQARGLVDRMKSHLDKPSDYENMLKLSNLETICLTATGLGGEEYTKLQKECILLIPALLLSISERFQRFWLQSDFIYSMSNLKKVQDKIIMQLSILSNKIIEKKKAAMKRSISKSDHQNSKKMKPFLELLLDISNETQWFTDQEIREETNTIIIAGHDTSALVLNMVLNLMGSYPEVQDKVYDEIIQVIGDSDRDVEKDDLSKLVYTEAVLKETLRLHPVAPMIARHIDRDIKIKNYTLKANSISLLSIYGLNRHPAWGPDADQFRPERWLDTATLPGMNHFASFSLGRRDCIGKAFAMMSIKTTLAHVVRKYRVQSDISKLVLQWKILAYPTSGHHLTLELRDTAQVGARLIHY